jgi:hypothetical protein
MLGNDAVGNIFTTKDTKGMQASNPAIPGIFVFFVHFVVIG